MTGDLLAPSGNDSLSAASRWVLDLLSGPFATTVAVLAIAALGYQMLTGRISARRALQVVLGCFIIFGSPVIVQSLTDAGQQPSVTTPAPLVLDYSPPRALPDAHANPNTNPFDPYANRPSADHP